MHSGREGPDWDRGGEEEKEEKKRKKRERKEEREEEEPDLGGWAELVALS